MHPTLMISSPLTYTFRDSALLRVDKRHILPKPRIDNDDMQAKIADIISRNGFIFSAFKTSRPIWPDPWPLSLCPHSSAHNNLRQSKRHKPVVNF